MKKIRCVTIDDLKIIPIEVQSAYLKIIMNCPFSMKEWNNVNLKYPEYFTKEKLDELNKISDKNKKLLNSK